MHRKSDKPVRYILVKMPEFYYTPIKSIKNRFIKNTLKIQTTCMEISATS